MKQAWQYLIFPEGILYNKEKDTVRTNKINLLFASISGLARVLTENKKDNLLQDCLFGSNVGMARFELATSWSQTRRDNRATLHPELKNIWWAHWENPIKVKTYKNSCGEGGIRSAAAEQFNPTYSTFQKNLRRGWDSNPRYSLTRTTI